MVFATLCHQVNFIIRINAWLFLVVFATLSHQVNFTSSFYVSSFLVVFATLSHQLLSTIVVQMKLCCDIKWIIKVSGNISRSWISVTRIWHHYWPWWFFLNTLVQSTTRGCTAQTKGTGYVVYEDIIIWCQECLCTLVRLQYLQQISCCPILSALWGVHEGIQRFEGGPDWWTEG